MSGAARRAAGLRRLRREYGYSMRTVTRRLGARCASTVSRWEDGTRTPPPAERIASCFGVTVAEVLADCPHCRYDPPAGYMCLRCGTRRDPATHPRGAPR